MKMTFFFLIGAVLLIPIACKHNQDADFLNEEIIRVQTEARSWVNGNGDYWVNYLRYEMEDESKQKFLPLVTCLDSIEQTAHQAIDHLAVFNEKIITATDQQQIRIGVPILQKRLADIKNQLRFHYHYFLHKNKEVFHISDQTEADIQHYLDQIVAPLNQAAFWKSFLQLNKTNQQLAIHTAILDWETVLTALLNHLGAGLIGCNRSLVEYTILVSPSQNIVRRGETFKARIWLAHNDDEYEPINKQVFVDDAELPLIANNYAEYISAPILTEQTTIKITALIEDPLTGMMEAAFPEFEYTIKTNK